MSEAGLPRLVFERWTDPVAGDILEAAEIDVVRLDLTAPAEQGWAVLESAHGYQVATRTDVARWPTAHSGWPGRRWWNAASSCWPCARPVRGTTSSTSRPAPEPASPCATTPGPGAEAVAEHALGFMLDLAKKITVADRVLRRGELGDRLVLRGSQLLGKTLGVIGLGAIGGRLVELCAPFGMEVLVFDPYLDEVAPKHAACSVSRLPNCSSDRTSSR